MTTINVTAEHIAKGKLQHCEQCPVALAIITALPGADVAIGSSSVAFFKGGNWTDIELPLKAVEFIWNFDYKKPVEPFTFDLDYPAVTA